MAITLTDTPTVARDGVDIFEFATEVPLFFEFTRSAGETSLQVQVCDSGGTEIATLQTLPFTSANTLTVDLSFLIKDSTSIPLYINDQRNNTALTSRTASVKEFTLKYRVAGTGAYTSIGGNYFAVKASRQIGETLAPTLGEYTQLISTGPVVDATASFMTKFERPTIFWYSDIASPASSTQVQAWYLGLSFLLEDSIVGNLLDYELIYRKNGTQVSRAFGGMTPVATKLVATPLPFLLDNCWKSDEVAITFGEEVAASGILDLVYTETITADIRRACQNPVAVRWVNTLGGIETWVFEGNTPREVETSGAGDYGVFPRNLATATGTRRMNKKDAVPRLSVIDSNLTLQQAKAIEEIAYSNRIWLYVGELLVDITYSFDDWQEVTLDTGSFRSYDTDNRRHAVEFTLNLPNIYTIGA